MRNKRRKLQLHKIKISRGRWIQGGEKIAKAAEKHFKNIFNLPKPKLHSSILNCIPRVISEDQNSRLASIPTEEDIKDVVHNLNGDSVVGPDGYNGTFFHSCWCIGKKLNLHCR